jgi:hypothetical protein
MREDTDDPDRREGPPGFIRAVHEGLNPEPVDQKRDREAARCGVPAPPSCTPSPRPRSLGRSRSLRQAEQVLAGLDDDDQSVVICPLLQVATLPAKLALAPMSTTAMGAAIP